MITTKSEINLQKCQVSTINYMDEDVNQNSETEITILRPTSARNTSLSQK